MRFSKATLAAHIQNRINSIQKIWGFDPTNGTYQIEPIYKSHLANKAEFQGGELTMASTACAFGEFQELVFICDVFELPVDHFGGFKTRRPISRGCTRYVADPVEATPA